MQIVRTDRSVAWRRGGNLDSSNALVMLHGLASNGSRWRELAETLNPPGNQPGWKVLAPDLRGHGHSARRGRIDAATWGAQITFMLERESISNWVLGGHCMGANVAVRLVTGSALSPLGLIIIEPMVPRAWAGPAARFGRFRFMLPVLAGVVRAFNALGLRRRRFPELDLFESDRRSRAEQTAEGQFNADYASPLRDLKYMPTASYLMALNETLRPLPDPSRVDCPCLAMLSSGGLFGDPEITRAWLSRIPRIEVHELQAQHWIPTEQPSAMREKIESFLERIAPEDI